MIELESAVDAPLTTGELITFAHRLSTLRVDVDDHERINQIEALERLKSAAAAAQAITTASFAESQCAAQREAGTPERRVGRGVAPQVALAKHESPARAARYVGWAKVLTSELNETFAALQRGETTEWRAMLVARETIWLSREQRIQVDTELAGRLGTLGDRHVEAETRRLAYRLDPAGFVARSQAAANDRRVTIRPAPDTMTRLTALLPVGQGVAAYAALKRAADTARASGDARSQGQVMADTLVERATGQAAAEDVSAEVHVVVSDRALFGEPGSPGRDEPGAVAGYGPVPAWIARDLAMGTDASVVRFRRWLTDPVTGHLTAADARAREFPRQLRRALIVRDQFCRTPWCGAPLRHNDHVQPVAHGGQTSFENGQGLCEACNYAKQAPGWTARPGPGGSSDEVMITTPTGHTYRSRAPDLPGEPKRTESRARAGPTGQAEEAKEAA